MSDYRLDVYEGVGSVRPIPILRGQSVKIGRTQVCDVVVKGPGVSRLHCELTLGGEGILLENKSSSKTGTKVNGERVAEARMLAVGDELTVGETVMVLALAEDEEAPSPSDLSDVCASADGASGDVDASDEGDADASDEGDADASDEAGSAREGAREFLERKRLERNLKLVVGIVCLALASGAGAYVVAKVIMKPEELSVGREPDASHSQPTSSGERGGEPREIPAESRGQTDADQAWHQAQLEQPDGLAGALLSFAERFPDDRRADDALFFGQQLRAAREEAGSQRLAAIVGAMLTEAKRLASAEDPARAQAVCELIESLMPGSVPAREARSLTRGLREAAAQGVLDLHDQAQALSARLGPVQAILLVLEAQTKLRGLGRDEALDDLVADLERQAAETMQARAGTEIELSGEAFTVEKRAIDAALSFDFPKAWRELDTLLTLGLEDEARLRAHWLRHQVRGLEDLSEAMRVAAKTAAIERRPSLTIGGELRARLKSFDAQQVVLAPIVREGEGELRWRWGRVTPYQVQELFAYVGERDYSLTQAKAFHAFRTGLEELGVDILLPFTSRKRLRSEVFSFYSLATGAPMPPGGFVVFEGRFVSPSERDRIQAARQEARDLAKQLAAEAQGEQERRKLLGLLAKALGIMDEGYYAAGRAALAEIAKRHAAVPGVGDVALRRLNSPVLRRRDVRASRRLGRNGPSANRLDIYFMGDGFVLDDRKQLQFDRFADSAVKACELQDFFKEYDQYINYWAVNLSSKEEGLTKDGELKDTALGTEINGGVYTVGGGSAVMFRLLQEWYPQEHDRVAVSIGNDFATVATGGGGAVAVAKTMVSVTPHELGHAYGGLGDEYDQEPGPNPGPPRPYRGPERVVAPNIVGGRDEAKLREIAGWKSWIDPTGSATWNWTHKPIDLFEGANRQPRGYWRPQRQCVMRDSGSPLCAVCMEVMVERLYRFVRPIDEVWPKELELTAGRETITLRVLVMKPKTHDLFVHWRRKTLELGSVAENADAPDPEGPDGTRERRKQKIDPEKTIENLSGKLQVIEGNYVHYLKIRPRELKPGRYELSAEVWDPTPWVRDSKKRLNQIQTWVLTVPER